MNEGTHHPSRPACPSRAAAGYFYLLGLTVQAQGRQTVAAACGNWLMSHLVTALARWQLAPGSRSRLEDWALQRRALCPLARGV